MVTISGKHFIFARVEQEYSPKNEGGFQIYYSSKDIPNSDLQLLKSSVECFLPSEKNIARKQYFRLPSHSFAFISTVVENHPEISDRSRRGGAFLSHGIIIDQKQYSNIHYNPFIVFDEFKFLKSAEEMITEFNQLQYRERPCAFDVDPYSATKGDPEFASKALSLYHMTSSIDKTTEPTLLIGQNNEIESFLRAALEFAPVALRPLCSFDTHADNCQIPSGLYWSIGSSFQRDGVQKKLRLSQDIPNPEAIIDRKDDLYYQWLQVAAPKDPIKAYQYATIAQIWANAIRSKKEHLVDTIDLDASLSFFQVHKKIVLKNLHKAISDLTSPTLAENIINFMMQSQIDIRTLLSIASSQVTSYDFLSPIVRSWLQSLAPDFSQLKKNDWTTLQHFASRSNDIVTLFWASAINKDQKVRQQCIKSLSENDYRVALLLIFSSIHPKDYLPCSDTNLKQLFLRFLPELSKVDNLTYTEFTLELFKVNSLDYLDELSPKVHELDNKLLTQLETKLPKLQHTSSFLNSVIIRRRELGRPKGIKGLFYRGDR